MKIWKTFNAEVDVGLAEIIKLSSHTAKRAPKFKLSIAIFRNKRRRKFFKLICVSVWNNHQVATVGAGSVDQFKRWCDKSMAQIFYKT